MFQVQIALKDQLSSYRSLKGPYDLRPAIQAIGDEVLRLQEQGKRVVVLMGEDHRMTSHILLRRGVLEYLLSSTSKLAYGEEFPCNLYPLLLSQFVDGENLSPEKSLMLSQQDPDGEMLLDLLLDAQGLLSGMLSYVARMTTYDFVRKRGVSMRFNDAAVDPDHNFVFDVDDFRNDSLMSQDERWHDLFSHSFVKEKGIAFRNVMMRQNVLEHMRDSHATVYVQSCGLNHLFYDVEKQKPENSENAMNDGLVALFNEISQCENLAVLAVLPNCKEAGVLYTERLCEAARHQLTSCGVVIDGLSNRVFSVDNDFSRITEGLYSKLFRPHVSWGWDASLSHFVAQQNLTEMRQFAALRFRQADFEHPDMDRVARLAVNSPKL